jgi:predicted amidohydrolase YtcJ
MNAIGRSTMILALVLMGCSDGSGGSADLVIRGGIVWTGVMDAETAEAVAVREGRIVAVGSDDDIASFIGSSTEVVELEGRLLTPGFIDSHVHFLQGGYQLSSVDLRDADSPEEFARRIGEFAVGLEAGEWIRGGDWDHERWGGELPRKEWVDAVTPQNPVIVSRLDSHMALANSLALEAGGVTRETAAPPGGEIVRDAASGEPTGVLKDEAMGLVFAAVPQETHAQLDSALQAAAWHALSMGVTGVYDMGTWDHLETYRRAHRTGRLPLRIYSVVPISTWERLRDFVAEEGRGDDRLWWGGLKGFVDGSLGSTTAWFYDPYADEPRTSGLMVTDTSELRELIRHGDDAGFQVVVHAIGDQANDWLLDRYQEAVERHGLRDQRFRIEHAQHLSRAAFPRFAELGVIPAMQPYHAIDDGRWAWKRIGPERVKTTYAFRSLLDADAPLAFGSDWTVAPLNVLKGIYGAVTRRTLDGANPDGWVPEEKITVEEALRAYTYGSAWSGFMEEKVGQIREGMYADLVVLSENILEMDPVGITEVRVDLTVVEGGIVHRRER